LKKVTHFFCRAINFPGVKDPIAVILRTYSGVS